MWKILNYFCKKVCRIKKSVYLCTRLQEISTTDDGAIAQLVEQRTENPCVPGSNPGGTTSKSSSYDKKVAAFFVVFRLAFGGLCKPVCKPRCKPENLWQQQSMCCVTSLKHLKTANTH